MLPAGAYLDQAVLDWEHEHFFAGWTCVGRSTDVTAPGAQAARPLGESSVLLVRDQLGMLRGFANSCRHRAHELLPCGATARKRSLVCPYHAWSYRLDGTLQAAPGMRAADGFEPATLGLLEMPVHEWHGWVFVDPSGRAGPFDDHVGALESIVAPYAPERLHVVDTHDYEIAANWKVIVENYQECYHCAMIHPELCRVSPPDSGENIRLPGDWAGGWMRLRQGADTMSLDGRRAGVAIAGLDEQELRSVLYVAVFPNLLVSLHPDYVMTHHLRPLAPDRTHVECAWAFAPEAVEGAGFDASPAVDFWDLTNRQDWAACESVQRGLRTPRQVPGLLAPDEDGVHDFVSRVARGYLGLV